MPSIIPLLQTIHKLEDHERRLEKRLEAVRQSLQRANDNYHYECKRITKEGTRS